MNDVLVYVEKILVDLVDSTFKQSSSGLEAKAIVQEVEVLGWFCLIVWSFFFSQFSSLFLKTSNS